MCSSDLLTQITFCKLYNVVHVAPLRMVNLIPFNSLHANEFPSMRSAELGVGVCFLFGPQNLATMMTIVLNMNNY
jgi:hypothetical protein